MIPQKLRPGDEIRVVSPATSLGVISPETRQVATETWETLGFKITFGENAEARDIFSSSSVEARVDDFHAAFSDPNVRAVLTTLGGYNCNQLLRYLDYKLIAANPKVLCGYSDITALAAAIHAKTGLVTYSGPHFSTFGMRLGLEYTLEYFRKCLMQADAYTVTPSQQWSDDAWHRDQLNRAFESNPGFLVLNEGRAQGTLIGGNLCTLNLLQGTEYMPTLAGCLLLIEDDEESHPLMFDRDLQSLLHQPGAAGIRGVVVGRFQRASNMTIEKLTQIIRSKRELAHIPVIANADFGHTTPQLTFPIGGKGALAAENGQATFSILEH